VVIVIVVVEVIVLVIVVVVVVVVVVIVVVGSRSIRYQVPATMYQVLGIRYQVSNPSPPATRPRTLAHLLGSR